MSTKPKYNELFLVKCVTESDYSACGTWRHKLYVIVGDIDEIGWHYFVCKMSFVYINIRENAFT